MNLNARLLWKTLLEQRPSPFIQDELWFVRVALKAAVNQSVWVGSLMLFFFFFPELSAYFSCSSLDVFDADERNEFLSFTSQQQKQTDL